MNSKTWMVVSLLITCLLAAFALAQVYAVTKPKVEQQKIDATNSALGQVLATAQTYKEVEKDSLWYGLDQSGAKVGIVVRSGQRGYGGPVPVLVGLDLTGRPASASRRLKQHSGGNSLVPIPPSPSRRTAARSTPSPARPSHPGQ
jgi:Na+-translocating ferredoxin:NAD+ oxidoreductase RnfG subunit